MKRSWYEIRNKSDDEADVYIMDEIGFWGITASEFVRELNRLDASLINLYLNSPGGEVFDGMAIYNALKNHKATVNVFIEGLAASAASFIAEAGDRIVIEKAAAMMIHDPYGLVIGNATDMRKMGDALDGIADTIAGIYSDRAGDEVADWRGRMLDETWYNGEQAVEAGLADEMRDTKGKAKNRATAFNLSRFKNVPEWFAQAPVRNAGRSMSQGNLDRLHDAIDDLGAIHDATCDMGEDCPMEPMDAAPRSIQDDESEAKAIVAAIESGLREATREVLRT